MSGPKPDALPLGDTPSRYILYLDIIYCQNLFFIQLTNYLKLVS